ncbi:MAG: alanyl-tRNA editing protein [Clostridia bacterium]|nr:alanyl-tRNA editing protein [Clostridia bacterium]
MTKRLFDTDSHLLEFEARVLDVRERDGGVWVLLDQTAFAPEAGGQPSDIGTLGGANVLDVREDGEELWHLVDKEIVSNETVCCKIDYFRRLRHLQNHTGEHIVTGLFHREYGLNNVGFHLGHEDVTLDLDGCIEMSTLRHIEHLANVAVAENRKVNILYPSDGELATLSYRAKGEIAGRVRLVEIEGLDLCACCVPHVKYTGEVGGIRLLSAMRYKGGTRIHMKCGLDAIAHSNIQDDRESELSQLLSLPPERLVEGVRKMADDLGVAKYRIVQMKRERICSLIDSFETKTEQVCLFESELEVNELRVLATGIAEKTGQLCAAFSGDDVGGYRFVLVDPLAFAETAARFRAAFLPKGGGKPPVLQGTVEATEQNLRAFFEIEHA